MKRVQKLIKRVKDLNVHIPVSGRVEFVKKRLDMIKPGELLFRRTLKRITESYYLPKELGVNVGNCSDYIVRLNGEYIVPGEPIAERLVSGGLTLKRIFSTSEGILSLERLSLGYVDILSETVNEDIVSPIYGRIMDMDIVSGVVVQTSALGFNGYNNAKEASNLVGKFRFVSNGNSIYVPKDLEERYDDCIVFAGKFAYPKMIEELYERGAMHVVVYAMNYPDYRSLSLPVTIIGGFGNITFPDMWYQAIKQLDNSYISLGIKKEASELYFADTGQYDKDLFVKISDTLVPALKRGMTVRIRDVENVCHIGKVMDVNSDQDYVMVETEDDRKVIINPNALDIISY